MAEGRRGGLVQAAEELVDLRGFEHVGQTVKGLQKVLGLAAIRGARRDDLLDLLEQGLGLRADVGQRRRGDLALLVGLRPGRLDGIAQGVALGLQGRSGPEHVGHARLAQLVQADRDGGRGLLERDVLDQPAINRLLRPLERLDVNLRVGQLVEDDVQRVARPDVAGLGVVAEPIVGCRGALVDPLAAGGKLLVVALIAELLRLPHVLVESHAGVGVDRSGLGGHLVVGAGAGGEGPHASGGIAIGGVRPPAMPAAVTRREAPLPPRRRRPRGGHRHRQQRRQADPTLRHRVVPSVSSELTAIASAAVVISIEHTARSDQCLRQGFAQRPSSGHLIPMAVPGSSMRPSHPGFRSHRHATAAPMAPRATL